MRASKSVDFAVRFDPGAVMLLPMTAQGALKGMEARAKSVYPRHA